MNYQKRIKESQVSNTPNQYIEERCDVTRSRSWCLSVWLIFDSDVQDKSRDKRVEMRR